METKELYLLTAFVCSACDGEIANEEIKQIKDLCGQTELFSGLDITSLLNNYVAQINKDGVSFINSYFSYLRNNELSEDVQLNILKLAIQIIEADNQILYSEIKFFKKIRSMLSVSDDKILAMMPDKEDYLLPDIQTSEYVFDKLNDFAMIDFKKFE
jgi:uncharacterized tellurite resistance protein B-like protein